MILLMTNHTIMSDKMIINQIFSSFKNQILLKNYFQPFLSSFFLLAFFTKIITFLIFNPAKKLRTWKNKVKGKEKLIQINNFWINKRHFTVIYTIHLSPQYRPSSVLTPVSKRFLRHLLEKDSDFLWGLNFQHQMTFFFGFSSFPVKREVFYWRQSNICWCFDGYFLNQSDFLSYALRWILIFWFDLKSETVKIDRWWMALI